MAKAASNVVGKGELCALLGWSRPRLDRRLSTDAKFPVKKRGTAAGGWAFDTAKVLTYLGGGADTDSPKATVKKAVTPATASAPEPDVAPVDDSEEASVEHVPEGTARQRRDAAQAAFLEDKLRLSRGELLERADVLMMVSTMVAHLGKGLDGLPDTITKLLGLPEESGDPIRTLIDKLRVKMATDLRAVYQQK
jgi:phage terminase Nu1 subunit (DNA packaging protein)